MVAIRPARSVVSRFRRSSTALGRSASGTSGGGARSVSVNEVLVDERDVEPAEAVQLRAVRARERGKLVELHGEHGFRARALAPEGRELLELGVPHVALPVVEEQRESRADLAEDEPPARERRARPGRRGRHVPRLRLVDGLPERQHLSPGRRREVTARPSDGVQPEARDWAVLVPQCGIMVLEEPRRGDGLVEQHVEHHPRPLRAGREPPRLVPPHVERGSPPARGDAGTAAAPELAGTGAAASSTGGEGRLAFGDGRLRADLSLAGRSSGVSPLPRPSSAS